MLEKVRDGIYYMPHDNIMGRPALGLICGKKYSLIIDAGNSPGHAEDFRKEISQLNIPPAKYLVLTHHHTDHTLGLKQWDDLLIVACTKTKEKVKNIDISFSDELVIELGGITCAIKEIPSSHTADSTIIYVPERKVMFLGDSLYTTYYNGKYRYNKTKTLQTIKIIEKYDTDFYIYSHDSLCECSMSGMQEFFTTVKTITQLIKEQYTISDTVAEFTAKYNRNPNSDELFVIKCFINGNILDDDCRINN